MGGCTGIGCGPCGVWCGQDRVGGGSSSEHTHQHFLCPRPCSARFIHLRGETEAQEGERGPGTQPERRPLQTGDGVRPGRAWVGAAPSGRAVTAPVPIGQKLLDSLAETWDFFFSDVLPTLQAIFYPVQVSGPGPRDSPAGRGSDPLRPLATAQAVHPRTRARHAVPGPSEPAPPHTMEIRQLLPQGWPCRA